MDEAVTGRAGEPHREDASKNLADERFAVTDAAAHDGGQLGTLLAPDNGKGRGSRSDTQKPASLVQPVSSIAPLRITPSWPTNS